MNKYCLACHAKLVGRQSKWCSKSCALRGAYNIKHNRPIDSRQWIPQKNCMWCGCTIIDRGPQSKFCSRKCNLQNSARLQKERRHAQRKKAGTPVPGELVPCTNPQCANVAVYRYKKAYCSEKCFQYVLSNKHWLGEGPSTRIFFYPCPDCSFPVLHRHSTGTAKVCKNCRVVRNKKINSHNSDARRAIGKPKLSVYELAVRDGRRCNICRRKIDLSLSGMAKWGPTIDHILPVSLGGTNDPNNLTLAHRCCNSRRGNREPAQMLLSA